LTVVLGVGGLASLELESIVDPEPAALPPRVRVTVTGVASALTFTLTRLCEGESLTVPGWRARSFTDSDTDVDFVAPLNRPVTYTLSADGVAICSATIVVDFDGAILQDPIQPERFLPVKTSGRNPGFLTMSADALQSVQYSAGGSRIQVLGSAYPVSIGGQVSAGSGVNASVVSDDSVTAAGFRRLRSGAPILLLRTSTDMVPLPALSYLAAEVAEQPVTVHIGGSLTRWQVTGDLVSAVVQAAISGFVTYDEVQQLLAGVTYDEVQAAYAGLTYLDVQKDPLVYASL
jgi:hypothetical protein